MVATASVVFALVRAHLASARICGASKTLATSTVVPGKQADVAVGGRDHFVVVAVNALATLAMLVFPPLCILLGLERRRRA
jgi:uncharacterized membrane protein YadS